MAHWRQLRIIRPDWRKVTLARPTDPGTWAALAAAVVVSCAAAAGADPAPPDPPCAACLVPAVSAAEGPRLAASGVPLEGLDLLFDAATPDPDTRSALAAAGARSWTTLREAPERFDAAGISGVWIEAPLSGSADEIVYAVRTSALALRTRGTDLRVGVVLDGTARQAAVARAVSPYVDAVRVRGTGGVDDVRGWMPGAGVWRDTTASDVLDASRGAGGARVVVEARDAVRLVAQVSALGRVLVTGLTPLPDVRVSCEGCEVTTWLHPDTLHAIAIVAGHG